MIWVGQNGIAYLSLLVIYVCLKSRKNLTLKTCALDFSVRSMTKLYAKIKGACSVTLFDFLKTWQVWAPPCIKYFQLFRLDHKLTLSGWGKFGKMILVGRLFLDLTTL